jgi:hypothetical protein
VQLRPKRFRDEMLIVSYTRRLWSVSRPRYPNSFLFVPRVAVRIDIESCSVVEDLLTEVPLSIFAETAIRKQTTQRGLTRTKPIHVAYISDKYLHLFDPDRNILRNLSHAYREWLLVAQATGEAPLTIWSL